ncbi:hypothetical protein C6501_12965 [Candidatus Poribacteria bacterium]|nr:MAG: hypothetical protein C6501_12965 [Candidatus Poribacteria bacterium]
MNILEHAQELINEIQNRLEENERTAEESVERIQNEIEEHRNAAEEQIEKIQNQIHQEAESAEEEIRRLHDGLEEHRRTVEEQIQKLQEESEEYAHKIEEDVERIQERLEQTRENAEDQIERIHEKIEQDAKAAEEQIERIREKAEEYRDNSDERIERIRERIEELRDAAENRTERFHFETDTWVEEHNIPNSPQSLIRRFDAKYDARHAATTVSNSYVMNGVEVLKYSGKLLPLTEMDERYPRSEWLQIFVDKNIPIENLEDYCRCLNARDMLIRIQKKPDVWTSGLFEIPPMEDWETYQEAYINQLTNPDRSPHV